MADAVEIGTRRELFLDELLIDRLDGAEHRLHPPVRREVVMQMDSPWECCTSCYYNLFEDEGRIRMYYRGFKPEEAEAAGDHTTVNLAESTDGVHFTRPTLGAVEVNGSRENNVVWLGPGGHNFCVFRDGNPDAEPEARYKAVGSAGRDKLFGFVSPDGIRWSMVQEEPLPIPGAFDSLNVAFWDERKGCYRLFSRYWEDEPGVRAIQSCESEDFLHWTDPVPHDYGEDVPMEQFYTNATIPCPGAEHILLSFPKRFVPDRTVSTEGMTYASEGLSDGVLMSSRDGVHWDRTFMEGWVRPGLDPRNWSHRSNMPARGIIPTAEEEWSLYVSEHYGWDSCRLRRLTVRPHGFASVGAGREGGELLTPPLIFEGAELRINFATSAAGSVAVELQEEGGEPIEGFALAQMEPMYGDRLDASVTWEGGGDLSGLAGRPVRMRFTLEDADLFALRTV